MVAASCRLLAGVVDGEEEGVTCEGTRPPLRGPLIVDGVTKHQILFTALRLPRHHRTRAHAPTKPTGKCVRAPRKAAAAASREQEARPRGAGGTAPSSASSSPPPSPIDRGTLSRFRRAVFPLSAVSPEHVPYLLSPALGSSHVRVSPPGHSRSSACRLDEHVPYLPLHAPAPTHVCPSPCLRIRLYS